MNHIKNLRDMIPDGSDSDYAHTLVDAIEYFESLEKDSKKTRTVTNGCEIRDKFAANARVFDELISEMLQENRVLKMALAKIADYPNGLNDNLTFSVARKIAKEALKNRL